MRVLQINCVYRRGSTGKIVYDLHTAYTQSGIESYVCYGRGARVAEERVYKTCPEWYAHLNHLVTLGTGILYGGCGFSTGRLIRIIRKEKPDVVHLHCINGYFVNIYRLITWLRDAGIPTVVTLHAEFMYTGGCAYTYTCEQWRNAHGCGYAPCERFRSFTGALPKDRSGEMWKRMRDAFAGFERNLLIASVSPWLSERAQSSVILHDKRHCTVLNGLDTTLFCPSDTTTLRSEMGLEGRRVLFHASPRFDPAPDNIKGSYYVLELARRMPDTAFVVAGPYAEGLKVPENVILLGMVSDQTQLASYYAMADATLLTSQWETYSMVTAESLCCGTPVVGFEAGAPERIALKAYSRFVPYGDLNELQAAAEAMLKTPKDNHIASAAVKVYGREQMAENYIDAYKTLLNEV